MTQEQKKEIREYRLKIEDVRLQFETEINKLADIFNKRDTAIYARDKALEEKNKSVVYLEHVKKEIINIDELLLKKRKEYNDFSESRSLARNKLNGEIRDLSDRMDNLKIEIYNLSVKYYEYIKLTDKYEHIKNEIQEKQNQLSIINTNISISYKELDKSKKSAEKILNEASLLKEKNEKEFAVLQEIRSGLDFYYERLRNWYHDHGLKLPPELEIENITKKI